MMSAQLTAFNQQTRIAINILIEDETGLTTFSIIVVTKMFVLLCNLFRFFVRTRRDVEQFSQDVWLSLDFTVSILIIALKSLLFGLGVKL